MGKVRTVKIDSTEAPKKPDICPECGEDINQMVIPLKIGGFIDPLGYCHTCMYEGRYGSDGI